VLYTCVNLCSATRYEGDLNENPVITRYEAERALQRELGAAVEVTRTQWAIFRTQYAILELGAVVEVNARLEAHYVLTRSVLKHR
jgi:hypothetical protein